MSSKPRLDVHVRSDPGRARERNEDSGDAIEVGDTWVLMVCDGMGGHADGHVASATALATLERELRARAADPEPFRALHDAMLSAHEAVLEVAEGSDMGTTAVVAHVRGLRCWYGWVGDSRFYLLRGGVVAERSEDHTRLARLVARGTLSAEEARDHPDAGLLTQALGANLEQVHPTVYEEPIELRPGDTIVMCTDGLHDLVSDHELPGIAEHGSARDISERLVRLANDRGGHDNITVCVAVVRDGSPAEATSDPTTAPDEPLHLAPHARQQIPLPSAETRHSGMLKTVIVFFLGVLVGILLTSAIALQASH